MIPLEFKYPAIAPVVLNKFSQFCDNAGTLNNKPNKANNTLFMILPFSFCPTKPWQSGIFWGTTPSLRATPPEITHAISRGPIRREFLARVVPPNAFMPITMFFRVFLWGDDWLPRCKITLRWARPRQKTRLTRFSFAKAI